MINIEKNFNIDDYVPYVGATTNVNLGNYSITALGAQLGYLNVANDGITGVQLTAVGVDLLFDGNTTIYFKAVSSVKMSVETTGVHVGIHDSGAGTSTYVPLFLYDNYGHAVKFQTVKMASSLGYNFIFGDHVTATEDWYALVTSLATNVANGVPFFSDDTNLISDSGLTYDKASQKLSIGTSSIKGQLGLVNGARTTWLAGPAANQTITLPPVPVATSMVNIDNAGNMSTVVNTGSGSNVLGTSPTIATPNITTSILLTRNNLITTPNYGFYARNTTAATSGVPVQISPNEQLSGTAWDGAASETSIFRSYVIPVTGTNPTTAYRLWSASVDGAAYVDSFKQWDNGDLEIIDANDIILGTTTGTKFGTATTQKLAFYNSAPIVQPTALTTALTTITYTAPGTPDYALQDVTNVVPYGFVDAEELRTFISVVKNLQDRVNDLETKLQSLGLIA